MLRIVFMMTATFMVSFAGTWILLELEARYGAALRRRLHLRPRPPASDDHDLLTR